MAVATPKPPVSPLPVSTSPIDDWPGYAVFADLGEFVQRFFMKGVGDDIEVGIFREEEGQKCATYAASTRPYVVGMGAGLYEAIADWYEELNQKWELAKDFRRPFAPAVENDVAAMGVFFGLALNSSATPRD